MKNLVLYGASSYSVLIKEYFESDSDYRIVGFCVDKQYRTIDTLCNLPVVDYEEIESYFPKNNHYIFVAIGYKSMRAKKSLYLKVKNSGYKFATYISKDAIVNKSNNIGDNCMILPGVILEPHAIIEENTFLNTGVTVCHHSIIKAHSFLAARSLVGGYTEIGENCFIGFQATVLQQLKIANETLIAAGATMLNNSEASTVYAGVPAKPIKSHPEKGIEII